MVTETGQPPRKQRREEGIGKSATCAQEKMQAGLPNARTSPGPDYKPVDFDQPGDATAY